MKLPTGVTTISADATKIATALQKVESLTGFVNTDSKTATAVSVAGVYAIKATLLTCTPYGVNTERLLVRGHRVPYVEQEVADEKTPLSGISLHTNYLLWVIIGLVITAIFILVLYLKEKKLQKKKNETS